MSDQSHRDDSSDAAAPGAEPVEPTVAGAEQDAAPSDAGLAAERDQLSAVQEQGRAQLEARQSAAAEIEAELATLLESGDDYHALARVCENLEVLIERGSTELFWGPGAEADAGAQVGAARSNIEAYLARVEAMEARHRVALGEVADQQSRLDDLAFDLHDVEEQQESRRREWVVEREETVLPVRRIAMPWMRGFEEDRRFRNTLVRSMAAALLLGLIIPLIDLPIPERDEIVEVPERFARFIREERQPPLAVREPTPEPEPPEPEEVEEPEETQVAEAEPVTEPDPQPEPSAKEKVASKGILAFRDNFSSLRSSRPAPRLGAEASLSTEGAAEVGLPQRNMVAAQGTESSGGINLASISRDVGGGGVALAEGVELARVASAIDGGGPSDRPRSTGAAAGRTDEEIQIVFDRYKAALYRLYNRALRQDPTLRGQMVLKLTIEPDGSVSLCNVQRSDMGAPELARQVAASVSGFDFGAKDVPPVTILYPIDFLPTA